MEKEPWLTQYPAGVPAEPLPKTPVGKVLRRELRDAPAPIA